MSSLAHLNAFEDEFGSPGRALSRLIRPAIAAPNGRTLVWGDWSAIEASAAVAREYARREPSSGRVPRVRP